LPVVGRTVRLLNENAEVREMPLAKVFGREPNVLRFLALAVSLASKWPVDPKNTRVLAVEQSSFSLFIAVYFLT